jgi:hypothetical protein
VMASGNAKRSVKGARKGTPPGGRHDLPNSTEKRVVLGLREHALCNARASIAGASVWRSCDARSVLSRTCRSAGVVPDAGEPRSLAPEPAAGAAGLPGGSRTPNAAVGGVSEHLFPGFPAEDVQTSGATIPFLSKRLRAASPAHIWPSRAAGFRGAPSARRLYSLSLRHA